MNRLEILQNRLKDIADCAIISDEVNRRYFTGMKSSAGRLVIFPEEAYFIIDFRYIEKARKCVKNCKVILEQQNPMGQLDKLLQEHGVATAAVDSETCSISQYIMYSKSLKAKIISDLKLAFAIREIREVKTEDEIERVIKAQRIAEMGFEHILEYISCTKTEREVSLELNYFMLSHGAEDVSFDTIVLSGANTSLPHGVPSDKPIKEGEFVLMDFGAVVDGYHSDMTRTVCVGKPSEQMEKVYNIVLDAQCAAISQLKAGISGMEFDKISRDIISAEGYGDNFGHSLGHGVGMEIHESPYASPNRNAKLLENSIITIEPGIYLQGEFGVRIEDFAVIKNDGCENLTQAPKNLICLKP